MVLLVVFCSVFLIYYTQISYGIPYENIDAGVRMEYPSDWNQDESHYENGISFLIRKVVLLKLIRMTLTKLNLL